MKFTIPLVLNCAMASAIICIFCFCAALLTGSLAIHAKSIICLFAPFPCLTGLLLCKVASSTRKDTELACKTIMTVNIFNTVAAISCLLVIFFLCAC